MKGDGMVYFLGVDVGGTKTHLVLADENGRVVGFGASGPGNPDSVGHDGLASAILDAYRESVSGTGIAKSQVIGIGLGVAGYDWPEDLDGILRAVGVLGFEANVAVVNDTVLGILAGTEEGWGVAVVSGTGCNAWGWTEDRSKIGRVTGAGTFMGEGAGASELLARTVQMIAYSWTLRGPKTLLADLFVEEVGAKDLEDFLAGLVRRRYHLDGSMVLLVFQAAREGDQVALDLLHWAGRELGDLANAVIRQIGIQDQEFDVVLVGSMYNGSPILQQEMERKIRSLAPKVRLKRLRVPPVLGAVILGMEKAGVRITPEIRRNLEESLAEEEAFGEAPV